MGKTGNPLAIVTAAINQIRDQRGDNDLGIDSVSYFQETIRQNFSAWLQIEGEKA